MRYGLCCSLIKYVRSKISVGIFGKTLYSRVRCRPNIFGNPDEANASNLAGSLLGFGCSALQKLCLIAGLLPFTGRTFYLNFSLVLSLNLRAKAKHLRTKAFYGAGGGT